MILLFDILSTQTLLGEKAQSTVMSNRSDNVSTAIKSPSDRTDAAEKGKNYNRSYQAGVENILSNTRSDASSNPTYPFHYDQTLASPVSAGLSTQNIKANSA